MAVTPPIHRQKNGEYAKIIQLVKLRHVNLRVVKKRGDKMKNPFRFGQFVRGENFCNGKPPKDANLSS